VAGDTLCIWQISASYELQGSQPWTVQFEARAKWDAWNEVKGMDAEEAKRQYVALLDKVRPLQRRSCYWAGVGGETPTLVQRCPPE